ncbi:SBBP repeat-containing protein [Lacipirellula limnantheis]|uniref:Beta-propeller repeat protein n=1 Tax=Lacipirellula limnantheis TaxID=2528024 RepID=A0A517U4Z5_9BACT|nr:SBBP repeat-containing protein [Lacipirellula limnantheis]QDT75701.1 Beta-propeller repeat protein [Lacipirellula limnantheis]
MKCKSARHLVGLLIAILCSHNLPQSLAAGTYTRAWVTYSGLGQRDSATALAIDSAGAPYLIAESVAIYGASPTPNAFSGQVITKFDPSGNSIWMQQLQEGRIRSAEFDVADNLYLGSETAGLGSRVNTDAFLIKLDHAGTILWNQQYGRSSNNDFDLDVAVDTQGNAFVAGATFNITGEPVDLINGAYVAKFDSNGDFQWVSQLGGLGPYAMGVSLLPNQDVVVAGQGRTSFLARLDSSGNVVWNRVLDFSSNPVHGTFATNSATDLFGNIYVVGLTNRPKNELRSDAFVAKFDSNGNQLWNRIFAADVVDGFENVTVDSAGNIFAAGTIGKFLGTNPGVDNYDALWVKYDANGNLLWQERFGTQGDDYLTGIEVDSFGRVFVAGGNLYTLNDYYVADADAFVARYDLVPEPHSLVICLGIFFASGVGVQRPRRR